MRIQPIFFVVCNAENAASACVYINIYIYTYRGHAGGSPEDVGTFSLSLIDICIFCRSCIQMGGWGGC